jgi:hypothetical protein
VHVRSLRDSSLRDSAGGGRLPPDRAGWHLLEAVR